MSNKPLNQIARAITGALECRDYAYAIALARNVAEESVSFLSAIISSGADERRRKQIAQLLRDVSSGYPSELLGVPVVVHAPVGAPINSLPELIYDEATMDLRLPGVALVNPLSAIHEPIDMPKNSYIKRSDGSPTVLLAVFRSAGLEELDELEELIPQCVVRTMQKGEWRDDCIGVGALSYIDALETALVIKAHQEHQRPPETVFLSAAQREAAERLAEHAESVLYCAERYVGM